MKNRWKKGISFMLLCLMVILYTIPTDAATLIFNPNGGIGLVYGDDNDPQSYKKVVSVNEIIQNLPEVTREDYIFKGWHIGALDGIKLEADHSLSQNGISDNSAKLYLIAEWEQENITVKFYGGYDGARTDNWKLKIGTAISNFPTVAREGYTLEGWFDEKNNQVTEDTVLEEDCTLTAHWKKNADQVDSDKPDTPVPPSKPSQPTTPSKPTTPVKKSYTVTFQDGEDTVYTGQQEQDTGYTKLQNLVEKQKSTKTRKFLGWVDQNGNILTDSADQKLTENTTFYAVWFSITYKTSTKVSVEIETQGGAKAYKVTYKDKNNKKKTVTVKPGKKKTVSNLTQGKTFQFTCENNTIKYVNRPAAIKIKQKENKTNLILKYGKTDKKIAGMELWEKKVGQKKFTRVFYTTSGMKSQTSVKKTRAVKGTQYKVRTYYLNGKKKVYSEYSNIITAKK